MHRLHGFLEGALDNAEAQWAASFEGDHYRLPGTFYKFC